MLAGFGNEREEDSAQHSGKWQRGPHRSGAEWVRYRMVPLSRAGEWGERSPWLPLGRSLPEITLPLMLRTVEERWLPSREAGCHRDRMPGSQDGPGDAAPAQGIGLSSEVRGQSCHHLLVSVLWCSFLRAHPWRRPHVRWVCGISSVLFSQLFVSL